MDLMHMGSQPDLDQSPLRRQTWVIWEKCILMQWTEQKAAAFGSGPHVVLINWEYILSRIPTMFSLNGIGQNGVQSAWVLPPISVEPS